MPRQIIILETNPSDGGAIAVNCVFWFAVTGTPVPMPGFVSAFKTPTGTEATALQDGTVDEEYRSFQFPKSFTNAEIKGSLVKAYADRKAYRDSQPNVNQFYGTSHDGTVWT